MNLNLSDLKVLLIITFPFCVRVGWKLLFYIQFPSRWYRLAGRLTFPLLYFFLVLPEGSTECARQCWRRSGRRAADPGGLSELPGTGETKGTGDVGTGFSPRAPAKKRDLIIRGILGDVRQTTSSNRASRCCCWTGKEVVTVCQVVW